MTDVSILNKTLSSISEQLDVCVHQNSVDESIILKILISVIVILIAVIVILIFSIIVICNVPT